MKNSILLNSELLKIGNDFMINYKEDIEVDVKHLLDKNIEENNFIWVVRKTGTNLYEESKLYIKENDSRINYLYFKDFEAQAYRLRIEKRGFKKVYGTIERIDRNKLTKDIEDRMKSYKKVHLKILKNDNNCIEIDVNTNDFNIYNVLDDLKLNIEEISKIYYQRYFN